ncbi:DUF4286 family protein [Rahnella ecdela]|uniref:Immunity protein 52 of polymorphic toxin system n=1 Tax=Rahnella ecdela TaxID=2816250 RepID=A0ABS6L9J1_9GAMM|nr:DUF4286 family protein [Rahnella ecdela]MBU9843607.1 hypothetical protein [Rahnella ecdela]
MSKLPNGMLFVATNVAEQDEADFNKWYDREHVEERVRIDGFLSGTRYQLISPAVQGRKYLGLYQTESLNSFSTDAYRAAFTCQSPWSVASLDKMVNPMRRVCAVEAVVGFGSGCHLAIIPLSTFVAGGALTVRIAQLGETLFSEPGFVRSRMLTPDVQLSSPLPKESTVNRPMIPMMVIDTSSTESCQKLTELACLALHIPNTEALLYGLSWHLTAQELK